MLGRLNVKPYWAVLRTYLQRPAFLVVLSAYLAWPAVDLIYRCGTFKSFANVPTTVIVADDLAQQAWHLALPILFGVAWAAHLREQLSGPRPFLVPRYVRPHLRVAGVVLLVSVLAIPVAAALMDLEWRVAIRLWYGWDQIWFAGPWWERGGEYLGGLLICTSLTLLAAWLATFGSPWLSALLAPLVLASVLVTHFNPWWMYGDLYFGVLARFGWFDRWNGTVAAHFSRVNWRPVLIGTFVPIVCDAAMLIALRSRIERTIRAPRAKGSERLAGDVTGTPANGGRVRLARTTWDRVRHRRSPELSGWAPWAAGLLVGIVAMTLPPLLYDPRDPSEQLRVSMILVTILPVVAVGCIWAERWPRVAAESLLPATRRQFVAEMTAAVGLDLAAFWVAVAAGVTVPLLVVPAVPIDGPALAARLGASAAVQALAFAAVLWAMVLRSWPAMATLLGLALGAMVGPGLMSSKRVPMVPVATLVPASVVVAGVGAVLAVAACRRWGAADLC